MLAESASGCEQGCVPKRDSRAEMVSTSCCTLETPCSSPMTVHPSQQHCLQETSPKSLATPQHDWNGFTEGKWKCPLESEVSEWQAFTLSLPGATPGNMRDLSAAVGTTGRPMTGRPVIGRELEVEVTFLRGHVHKLSLKKLWRHSELPLGKCIMLYLPIQ